MAVVTPFGLAVMIELSFAVMPALSVDVSLANVQPAFAGLTTNWPSASCGVSKSRLADLGLVFVVWLVISPVTTPFRRLVEWSMTALPADSFIGQ